MSHAFPDAASLAQERRLAQLTDDNAFLDMQALARQRRTGTGGEGGGGGRREEGGSGSGRNDDDGVSNSALARLRGQSRVHLPSSYASQHKTYLDAWVATWRTVGEKSLRDSEEEEGDDGGSGEGKPDGKPGKRGRGKAAAGPSAAARLSPATGHGGRTTQPARKARRRLQRGGERHAIDLRDPSAVADALDEEYRLLKAWHTVQSARCSPAAQRRLRPHRSQGGTNQASTEATTTVPSLLGMSDEEALSTLDKQSRGRDVPRCIDAEVLLALMRCPSHTAMQAPPPTPLVAGRGAAPVERQRNSKDEAAVGDGARTLLPVAVAPAPGTAGGVHGGHLCSVCLKPASYRCLRCKTALFCSVDCHVVHDATRCLKFIV